MHWADVPVYDPIHIAGSGSGPDRFTQPGRNYTVSLSYDFK
jgi:hemoglobin/transferrin/lactoferrin receptor protein